MNLDYVCFEYAKRIKLEAKRDSLRYKIGYIDSIVNKIKRDQKDMVPKKWLDTNFKDFRIQKHLLESKLFKVKHDLMVHTRRTQSKTQTILKALNITPIYRVGRFTQFVQWVELTGNLILTKEEILKNAKKYEAEKAVHNILLKGGK